MKTLFLACLLACLLLACVFWFVTQRLDPFTTQDALQIYVINLKRRPDRLETCLRRFSPGITPTIVEAVDGTALKESTKLTKGEFGCFMSHLKALRQFLLDERGSPYALIMEDDAVLDFPKCLDTIQELVKNAPTDFGVLSLGCNYFPSAPQIIEVAPGLVSFRDYDLYGAHALLYSRQGAERFLRHAMRHGIQDVPFDLWLTKSKAAPVFIAKPPLATVQDIKDTDTQRTR